MFFDVDSGCSLPRSHYKERKLHMESSMPERVCISSLQGMEFSRKRYIPPPGGSISFAREYYSKHNKCLIRLQVRKTE